MVTDEPLEPSADVLGYERLVSRHEVGRRQLVTGPQRQAPEPSRRIRNQVPAPDLPEVVDGVAGEGNRVRTFSAVDREVAIEVDGLCPQSPGKLRLGGETLSEVHGA